MIEKSNHISIRHAGAKDANVLSQMGRLTFTQSYVSIIPAGELASYTSRAFSLEQVETELCAEEITYLLALAGTEPCGYSKLAPTPVPPAIDGPNPVELARLYILPEWAGKGIGTLLIKEALGAALEQNYGSCWLRVWIGNERAIRFYHRWGFREIGSEPYNVGRSSERVFLMIRDLVRK
jgi:GNAT superfamily N-acetyltransferase